MCAVIGFEVGPEIEVKVFGIGFHLKGQTGMNGRICYKWGWGCKSTGLCVAACVSAKVHASATGMGSQTASGEHCFGFNPGACEDE